MTMMVSTSELRERVGELVDQAEAGMSIPSMDASVAMERLYSTLMAVADELDRPVPGCDGDTVLVSQHRLCRVLAQRLGMEVPA